MKKFIVPTAAAIALSFSTAVFAQGVSKDQYNAEKDRIKASADSAKQRCDSLNGNAKDICQAEAKGNEKVARAELEARYKGTDKARRDAVVAKAEADHAVAKERCDEKSGNEKDVCLKEAKAALTQAKADAKADKRVSSARREARQDTAEARRDAADDKRDAQYRVAKERCDALSGDAKEQCVNDAKSRYGKS